VHPVGFIIRIYDDARSPERQIRKVDQKYPESFKLVLEKNGEDQLDRSYEKLRNMTNSQGEENVLRTVNRRKENWVRHVLRRNCFLKHVTDGKIGEGYSDRKKSQ